MFVTHSDTSAAEGATLANIDEAAINVAVRSGVNLLENLTMTFPKWWL
jgi:hypothetical protein